MTGPTLTFDQIQSLWIQNGGSPGWAPLAAAIAIAESGGNSVALNNDPSTGDYSVGLWQINYYGSLLNPRTTEYGGPSFLQGNPDAQAKAAIALSGNGTNWAPWKTDAAWRAWQAAGSPSSPTKAAIAGWGVSLGGAGGTGSGAYATETGSGNPPASGTGCAAKGKIFGVVTLSFSYCQGKALLGGILVGVGFGVMLMGVILVMAWGLVHTPVGRGAAKIVRSGGPVGAVARAVA